jgi:cephalosporin-C deacetylase-like acetyl esterase
MDADAGCNHFATERMMIERRDVEFEVEGGDRLRGWLFVPENRSARHPAMVKIGISRAV